MHVIEDWMRLCRFSWRADVSLFWSRRMETHELTYRTVHHTLCDQLPKRSTRGSLVKTEEKRRPHCYYIASGGAHNTFAYPYIYSHHQQHAYLTMASTPEATGTQDTRRIFAITETQKQALIDNLQLESVCPKRLSTRSD